MCRDPAEAARAIGDMLERRQVLRALWPSTPRGDPSGADVIHAATGRVRLTDVEIDGKPWETFDPIAMTVDLPESQNSLTVKVRLTPTA